MAILSGNQLGINDNAYRLQRFASRYRSWETEAPPEHDKELNLELAEVSPFAPVPSPGTPEAG